ncbi:MAG: glycosyltransferase family 4 protein [Paracoccaceae bacterium]
MKILFLVSSMGGGGAERVAALLCNAWAERADEVVLMPTFSGRGEIHYGLDPRVRVEFLSDRVKGRRNRLLRLYALRQSYRRLRPDVVVSFLTDVNVAALLAGIGVKVPIIVSERTFPPHRSPPTGRLTSLLRKFLYRRAAQVVVQTLDTADWVRRECGDCKLSVIANPVSAPAAPEQSGGPAKDRKLILAVGRLIASKRFEFLLQSFAGLAREFPDWDVCILGDGPLREPLHQAAEGLGLQERVLLPGFSKTPGDWYSRADIYVLTSSCEGMPSALIEAMAHGIAPIAFDIMTGPKDVMQGGALGTLLPDDHHVGRLTEALRSLMSDHAQRAQMGADARAVLDRHAMPRILAEWDRVLQEVTCPPAVPRS